MSSIVDVNKPPFTVSPRAVDYFRANHPIHYEVLVELVRRGEAIIEPQKVQE
jgi:hypothetical protein